MIVNYIIPSLNIAWLGLEIVLERYDMWSEGETLPHRQEGAEMRQSECIFHYL